MTKPTLPTLSTAVLAAGVMLASTAAQADRVQTGRLQPDTAQQLARDLATRGVPQGNIKAALIGLGFALLNGRNSFETVNGITTVSIAGAPIAGKEGCRSGGVGFKRVGSTKDFDVLDAGIWCWTPDGWTSAASQLRGEMEQASTAQPPQPAPVRPEQRETQARPVAPTPISPVQQAARPEPSPTTAPAAVQPPAPPAPSPHVAEQAAPAPVPSTPAPAAEPPAPAPTQAAQQSPQAAPPPTPPAPVQQAQQAPQAALAAAPAPPAPPPRRMKVDLK